MPAGLCLCRPGTAWPAHGWTRPQRGRPCGSWQTAEGLPQRSSPTKTSKDRAGNSCSCNAPFVVVKLPHLDTLTDVVSTMPLKERRAMHDNVNAQDGNNERHRDGCECCNRIDKRIERRVDSIEQPRAKAKVPHTWLQTPMAPAWATLEQKSAYETRETYCNWPLRLPEKVAECHWSPTDMELRCKDIHPTDRKHAQTLDLVAEARRRLAANPEVSPELARRLLAFDEDFRLE